MNHEATMSGSHATVTAAPPSTRKTVTERRGSAQLWWAARSSRSIARTSAKHPKSAVAVIRQKGSRSTL